MSNKWVNVYRNKKINSNTLTYSRNPRRKSGQVLLINLKELIKVLL